MFVSQNVPLHIKTHLSLGLAHIAAIPTGRNPDEEPQYDWLDTITQHVSSPLQSILGHQRGHPGSKSTPFLDCKLQFVFQWFGSCLETEITFFLCLCVYIIYLNIQHFLFILMYGSCFMCVNKMVVISLAVLYRSMQCGGYS